MGRKAKFDETNVSSGHGKKAKKQGDPTFPKGILGMENYKFINMYQSITNVFIILSKNKKKKKIYYIIIIFSERRKEIKSQTKATCKKKIIKKTKYKRKIKGITKKKK